MDYVDHNSVIDSKRNDTRTAKHLLNQLQHTRAHLGELLAKVGDKEGYQESMDFCADIEDAIKDIYFDTYDEELFK